MRGISVPLARSDWNKKRPGLFSELRAFFILNPAATYSPIRLPHSVEHTKLPSVIQKSADTIITSNRYDGRRATKRRDPIDRVVGEGYGPIICAICVVAVIMDAAKSVGK
jgi:hypothetical protein